MDVIVLIGRIVMSMIFIGAGMAMLANPSSATPYAQSRGFANPEMLIRINAAASLAAGTGVVLGIWIDLALLGMVAISLSLAFVMHPFFKFEGEEQELEMSHFMKNISMAGGAFAMFGFIAGTQYSELMVTNPLFDIS